MGAIFAKPLPIDSEFMARKEEEMRKEKVTEDAIQAAKEAARPKTALELLDEEMAKQEPTKYEELLSLDDIRNQLLGKYNQAAWVTWLLHGV